VIHLHLAVRDLPHPATPLEGVEIARADGLRLTVGGPEENDAMIQALKASL